jgi:hypothetical protein
MSDSDLGTLLSAPRSGRFVPPFAALALQRFCPGPHVESFSKWLDSLEMDATRIAVLVEAVYRLRQLESHAPQHVDLVWTGPETLGAASRDTGVVVRELFLSAKREVLVAGFAIPRGRNIFEALADRMNKLPALKVRMFFDVKRPAGDISPASELVARFADHFRAE